MVAPGDLKAGGQALDVPFPRPARGLIEVVYIEEQMTLGRPENTKVGQVRVATQPDLQARLRRGSQIGSHRERGPAEVAERRDQHPPIADRPKLRDARARLPLQKIDRAASVRTRLPRGVACTRNFRARSLSARSLLLKREAT